ncbi:flavin reductase family protein [Algicola sagamiensis]|uniref:flavin reductase family protein n=1 Tax=Algicola sagamiensis TaxID=163869 RepID=UPI00035FDDD1|nr:flavin reductase family protein [Algicola sagamiensis]
MTQKLFSATDIAQLDDRYRASFVNSLSGFKSANLIGTTNTTQQNNLAIVSSVFHLGAHPPLMGMISRPHVTRRDTLENILELGVFTINHVHKDFTAQAHQTSGRYVQDISEFDAVGLTPEFLNDFPAPYVKESQIKIGLKLIRTETIPENNTVLIIGQIEAVHLDPSLVLSSGFIDIEKAGTVAVSGLDSYYETQRIQRYAYAKPNQETKSISDS